MLNGFKNFILRGNIIELAIAVVIGTAFTALVSAFAKYIINPIIAAFGGKSVDGLAFYLIPSNKATLIDFGSLITAFLTFLITAAVVYFVFVLPMNKLAERRTREQTTVAADPTELQLLIQIRDLLATEKSAGKTL